MKRLILTIALALFINNISAQLLTYTSAGYTRSPSFSGYHVSLSFRQDLCKYLYFYPQFILNRKGHTTFHATYLEMPLNIMYQPSYRSGWFVCAGPYLARGLSGKANLSSSSGKQILFKSNPPASPNNNIYFHPYDLGINTIVGYEWFSGWMVNANYSYGFLNAWHSEPRISNRYLGLSVGYLISRKVASCH